MKAVIGMGVTGLSVARYLVKKSDPFVLLDTREAPDNLDQFKREFPQVAIELGPLNTETLLLAEEIIVSPGVALAEPALKEAVARGLSVIGDVDLFTRDASAPIVAITGSNAKSTVTALLGEMASKAGLVVSVGGNIGRPVLDLLDDEGVQLYVLELSSFQLETVQQLNAAAATVLNISADHMDRYPALPAYVMAKQRIYFGAKSIVVNREDVLTQPPLGAGIEMSSFGLDKPDRKGFGLLECDGQEYLAYEFEPLMPVADIKVPGRHNVANALAAMALGQAVDLPVDSMLETLKTFAGLPHRCQWVRKLDGVDYYNDSKGTNIGATQAAISGLARKPAALILIAGGVGKGADFTALKGEVEKNVETLILIGRDAPLIETALSGSTNIYHAASLNAAVEQARGLARAGDAVLLSPACASFDMFAGFESRGDAFVEAVEALSC